MRSSGCRACSHDLVTKYATEGYGPKKSGYGGYGASPGVEEGQRLPIGLSSERLALIVVTSIGRSATPAIPTERGRRPACAVVVPAHTLNRQGCCRFLIATSPDSPSRAARLLPESTVHFPLIAATTSITRWD